MSQILTCCFAWGKPSSWQSPKAEAGEGSCVFQANQDAIRTVLFDDEGRQQALILVMDGHGMKGEIFSAQASAEFESVCRSSWPQLRTALEKEVTTAVNATLISVFATVESTLSERHKPSVLPSCNQGGTTATVVCVVDGRWVVCANKGDSCAVIASKNANNKLILKHLTEDHCPDSPVEWERYSSHCRSLGREPLPYIYGRINVGPRKLPGTNGDPLSIWEQDLKGGKAKLNESNADFMSKMKPGGVQSVRRHLLPNGQAHPDHRHENFGSTVGLHGGLACTRAVGDYVEQERCAMIPTPSVNFLKIDPTRTYALCVASDGFWDAHYFDAPFVHVFDSIQKQDKEPVTLGSLANGLWERTLNSAKSMQWPLTAAQGPAWDDVVFSITLLSPVDSPTRVLSTDSAASSEMTCVSPRDENASPPLDASSALSAGEMYCASPRDENTSSPLDASSAPSAGEMYCASPRDENTSSPLEDEDGDPMSPSARKRARKG